MLYRFTHLSGTNANHVDSVESTPITLGRDDACHIRFDKQKDLAVSAQHARIDEVSEGTWQIENLSKNGVVVNGVACDATAKLPNHSTIQLGKDGPRVRFDVDQNVGGISKADVVRKERTKKIQKNQVMREKAPTTEERPVFQIPVETPVSGGGMSKVAIGIIAGALALAVLGALAFFFMK